MKLSLIGLSASLAILSAACGNTDPPSAPTDETPAEATEPPSAAGPRKMIDGTLLATSPVNLLTDPGFALVGQQGGYGSLIGYYDNGTASFTPDVAVDSRSPAGSSGYIVVRPAKATDTKSTGVTLLASFLGGKGPFHAQVWVSKSNTKDEPVDFKTSDVTVSVADGDPDMGPSFDLKPVADAQRTAGGRTWILLKADITAPLSNGGFFVIHTGAKGGHVSIAAPQITSDELLVGKPVLGAKLAYVATPRARASYEQIAIKRYASLPPRLVPSLPTSPSRAD